MSRDFFSSLAIALNVFFADNSKALVIRPPTPSSIKSKAQIILKVSAVIDYYGIVCEWDYS